MRASQLAAQFGGGRIGTEHLLLSLLADERIFSSRILAGLDVDVAQARRALLHLMGVTPSQQSA